VVFKLGRMNFPEGRVERIPRFRSLIFRNPEAPDYLKNISSEVTFVLLNCMHRGVRI